MTSPSPVPPYLRVIEPSACVNAVNSPLSCSFVMPIPVSMTLNESFTLLPITCSSFIWSVMLPLSVNLVALLIRFVKICERRSGSPINTSGISGSISTISSIGLCAIRTTANVVTSLITCCKISCVISNSCFLASIFEKSKMLLIILNSDVAAWLILSTNPCWRSSSCVSWIKCAMPIMAFIGVLISWLMLAKNSLLAWVACSAISRAATTSEMSIIESM